MQKTTEPKLRNSAVRNTIHSYLLSTKAHPSVEMIYSDLKKSDPSISIASIYRNLRQLEVIGYVVKVATVSGHERYDADTSDHVHFICDKCDAVLDVMDSDIPSIKNSCNTGTMTVNRVRIVLHGICDCCADKS